jgi:transcriptional regulator with XRE-family HTH domain
MPYPFQTFGFRLVSPFRDAAAGDPAKEGPPHLPGSRSKGSKRPHSNATVAAVRRLIEETTLSHSQIEARTGVTRGTIAKWKRDGSWQRPAFAQQAYDTRPTARARHKLKLRLLGSRLHALAERYVEELTASPTVDLDRLIAAIQVMNMARLEYMSAPRLRRVLGSPKPAPRPWVDRDTAIDKALKDMRRGGVTIECIPEEAMALLEEAHTPPAQEDWEPPARRRKR